MDVYVTMAAVGVAYAVLVYFLREQDPDHGLTPWLVVVGDGLIVVGMYWLYGAEVGVQLVLLLALAGAPQIVGYYVARIRQRKGASQGGVETGWLSTRRRSVGMCGRSGW